MPSGSLAVDPAEQDRGRAVRGRESFGDRPGVAAQPLRRLVDEGVGEDRAGPVAQSRRATRHPGIADVRDDRGRPAGVPAQPGLEGATTAARSAKTSGWSHSALVRTATAGLVRVEVAGVLVGLDDERRRRCPSRAVAGGAAGERRRQQRADERRRVGAGRRRGRGRASPTVVLLPCVPATPTSVRPTAASATTCCHGSTGMPASRAARELGVVGVDRGQRLGDREAVRAGRGRHVGRGVRRRDHDPERVERRRVRRRAAGIAARDDAPARARQERRRARARPRPRRRHGSARPPGSAAPVAAGASPRPDPLARPRRSPARRRLARPAPLDAARAGARARPPRSAACWRRGRRSRRNRRTSAPTASATAT